jgi:hypothetical protein
MFPNPFQLPQKLLKEHRWNTLFCWNSHVPVVFSNNNTTLKSWNIQTFRSGMHMVELGKNFPAVGQLA